MGIMDFFGPAWQSKNENRALRAVEKIGNQALLAEVAVHARFGTVKEAAIRKISDDATLMGLFGVFGAENGSWQRMCDCIIAALGDNDNRAWAMFTHGRREGREALDILLSIKREEMLLSLLDAVFTRFEYGLEETLSALLRNKADMPRLCDALWQRWFQKACALKNRYGTAVSPGMNLVNSLAGPFRGLGWAAHCPDGFPQFLVRHGKYQQEDGGVFTIIESDAAKISHVFETLYRDRPDFRAQILALNGRTLFGGSAGGTVGGTGDNDMRWSSSGALPIYLDITATAPDAVTVYVGDRID